MRIHLFLLVFAIVLYTTNSIAQTNLVGVSVGYSKRIDLNYYRSISETKKVGITIGYVPKIYQNLYWETGFMGLHLLMRGFNQKGVFFGLNYKVLTQKNANVSNRFSLEYSRLFSGTYLYDPGFSVGSNYTPYYEFSNKYHNLSLLYAKHFQFGKSAKFDYYYECGITLKFIYRQFACGGGAGYCYYPINDAFIYYTFAPLLRIGLNYSFDSSKSSKLKNEKEKIEFKREKRNNKFW